MAINYQWANNQLNNMVLQLVPDLNLLNKYIFNDRKNPMIVGFLKV